MIYIELKTVRISLIDGLCMALLYYEASKVKERFIREGKSPTLTN